MPTPLPTPRTVRCLTLAIAAVLVPHIAHAQTGKWFALVNKLTITGSVDLTVEPRNDTQSKAKIILRNSKRETRLAWDIVAGRCQDEGAPIAAQAAFTQVMTQMDGGGTATANIPKLESGKLYYLRVFDPQTAASDVTALGCANIAEQP